MLSLEGHFKHTKCQVHVNRNNINHIKPFEHSKQPSFIEQISSTLVYILIYELTMFLMHSSPFNRTQAHTSSS